MQSPRTGNTVNIIILLTDGQSTVGATEPKDILYNVRKIEKENTDQCVIYTLGFGDDVDFDFLKKLALQSGGFARKIYANSDVVLQLQNFYHEIALPLLENVKVTYEGSGVDMKHVTNHPSKTYSKGKEILVAGNFNKLRETKTDAVKVEIVPKVEATTTTGRVKLTRSVHNIFNPGGGATRMNLSIILERMWAYLTVQDLAKEIAADEADCHALNAQLLEMSLNFQFVTPMTSMVACLPQTPTDIQCIYKGTTYSLFHVPDNGAAAQQKFSGIVPKQEAPDRRAQPKPLGALGKSGNGALRPNTASTEPSGALGVPLHNTLPNRSLTVGPNGGSLLVGDTRHHRICELKQQRVLFHPVTWDDKILNPVSMSYSNHYLWVLSNTGRSVKRFSIYQS